MTRRKKFITDYDKELIARCLQDHWSALTIFLASTAGNLLEADKAIAPLDLLCVDADDSVIIHLELRADGTTRDYLPGENVLFDSVRHPLTLTIADKNGKSWGWEIPEPENLCQGKEN